MGTMAPENLSRLGKKKFFFFFLSVVQERKISLPSLLLNPRETSWVKTNADEGIQILFRFFLFFFFFSKRAPQGTKLAKN